MTTSEFAKKPFLEMILIAAFMLLITLLFPQLKIIAALLPIAYFIAEPLLRKRQSEIRNFANPFKDLPKVWGWVLLVGALMQLLYTFIFKNYFPDIFAHLLERAPLIENFGPALIIQLIVLALGEEIAFRGLIQGRLQWVMKPGYAIIVTSLIFALMHLSPGEPATVALDLTTVFIDSVLFGIIMYKTKNIYVSTIAHALANIVAAFAISLI